jgi:hypothetical protein
VTLPSRLLRTELSFSRVKMKYRRVVSFTSRSADFSSCRNWTDRTQANSGPLDRLQQRVHLVLHLQNELKMLLFLLQRCLHRVLQSARSPPPSRIPGGISPRCISSTSNGPPPFVPTPLVLADSPHRMQEPTTLANADGDAPPPLESTSFADTETFSFPSSHSLQMQNVAGDSLTPHQAGFLFDHIGTEATPASCVYLGQIRALRRIKRTSPLIISGPMRCPRRAFT